MAKDARIYFMDIASTGGLFSLPADLNELYQPSYTGNLGGAARISSNSWGATSSQRPLHALLHADRPVRVEPPRLPDRLRERESSVRSVR